MRELNLVRNSKVHDEARSETALSDLPGFGARLQCHDSAQTPDYSSRYASRKRKQLRSIC
ncbi:MAG: hypothetical protein JWM11_1562 [Planctomycetaceae bacterium]|nr:hypothetical protein [Planctomycetaceae bacterium]